MNTKRRPADLERPSIGSVAIVLLVLALILPAAPNFIYLWCSAPRGYWFVQTATSLLLVSLPVLAGARVRFALLLLAPFAITTPLLCAYAWFTLYPPSILAFQVLREASLEELGNFIPAIAGCFILTALILLLYWEVGRRWGGARVTLPLGLRIAGLMIFGLAVAKDVLVSGPVEGAPILLARMEAMAPISPVILALDAKFRGDIISDRRSVLHRYVVTRGPAKFPRQICVLVIGESARRRAFGLYNSDANTTPLLSSRRDLIVFSNMRSGGTATIQSVPILLTGRFPDAGEILPFRHLGVIEAFRLAGFKTCWFSTQEADGAVASFITAFAENAEEQRYINGRIERSKLRNPVFKHDGALLSLLNVALDDTAGDLLIVLHTQGGHMPYTRRYPPSFNLAAVDESARDSMWRWAAPYTSYQQQQLDRAYSNTVRYTDWFLDQVIEQVRRIGTASSVIFVADHGENDASAPSMPAGHAVLTEDVVDIPMFVWLSPELRSVRPSVAQALIGNASRFTSAQDVFSTMCALNSIDTSEAEPTRNLASGQYREHERRALLLDGRIVTLPAGPLQSH